MGIETAIIVGAAAAAATAGASIYSSNKQANAQRSAARAQERASAQALKEQQQQFNRENQNEVNISSLLESNTSGSNSATMITGPGGIGRNQLNLGGGASLLGA